MGDSLPGRARLRAADVRWVRDRFGRLSPPALWCLYIIGLVLIAFGLFIVTLQYAKAAEICVPEGRVEVAPVPELVFVAGIPEVVQLGAFVLDPANPWTPGDLTRSSGWKNRLSSRLVVDGSVPNPLSYDGQTGELTFDGSVLPGDHNARLEVGVAGQDFRIRVLRPTAVFGDAAAAVNTAHGWGAGLICETPMSFAACRKKFKGGSADGAPLVLFITPGRYSGDFYLGTRNYVYVLGDPASRPELVGDDLALNKPALWQIRGLRLTGTRIGSATAHAGLPTEVVISNVSQCCESADRNGIVNPNTRTDQPWRWRIWSFESTGMGSPGNTVHAAYLEGRPDSRLEITNTRWLGSRGSSSVKTTMQDVAIRHSLFSVSAIPGDVSVGMLTHTPIDIPSVSRLVAYGNEFQVYRVSTVQNPVGRTGVLAGTIFQRLRKPGLRGSDRPAYPDRSWSPPVTSQQTASSPGGGWPAGPETFTSDDFWLQVRSRPITDHDNPLAFQSFIGFNRFTQLPGSLPVTVLRTDGTHPAEPIDQFGPGRPLRTHALWVERTVAFLYGNVYGGMVNPPLLDLTSSELMKNPEPGAKWPRTKDEEFPHAVILDGELPAWFAL